ncbi:MAG: hypothetical protein ACI9H8_001013 [Lysobacterales bacterium]|jgi:hypothetical protein
MTELMIIGCFIALFILMALMVIWARRRTKGVLAVGAFLSVFAPDPALEQKIKMVEVAKESQSEEEEEGEKK